MRQTVVGVFDGFEAARHAAHLLRERGIDEGDIRLTPAGGSTIEDDDAAHDDGDRGRGLLQRVRDFFAGIADDDDVGQYSEHLRRGGAVVAVDVDDDGPRVDTACEVLRQAGAVDIDEHAARWRAGAAPATPTTDDRSRWPDGLSGGGDTDGHRTGLGAWPGVGGGADVPMGGGHRDRGGHAVGNGIDDGAAGPDAAAGYAADPDDLIRRGRADAELSVEFPGGTGDHHRVSFAPAAREGRPLENRALTVPDTEVRDGLTSTVTPAAGAQAGSAASGELAARSAERSHRSQDDGGLGGGATRSTAGLAGVADPAPLPAAGTADGATARRTGGVRIYARDPVDPSSAATGLGGDAGASRVRSGTAGDGPEGEGGERDPSRR